MKKHKEDMMEKFNMKTIHIGEHCAPAFTRERPGWCWAISGLIAAGCVASPGIDARCLVPTRSVSRDLGGYYIEVDLRLG